MEPALKPATQAIVMAPAVPVATAETKPRPSRKEGPLWRLLRVVASLRITVVLFVLSLLLVFWGTFAQVDAGIWTVVERYFRSYTFVLIPMRVFLLTTVSTETLARLGLDFSIPFPGGWLIGGIMMVNLLAAHIVHFKLSWKRSGVLLLHAGIIIMMLSELITGIYAVEGHMTIRTGSSSNYIEHSQHPEIAIFSRSADPKKDDVVVIPKRLLVKDKKIENSALPFDVEIVEYMNNASVVEILDKKWLNPANKGEGLTLQTIERPEVSGTDPEQKIDLPAAYVRFKQKKTGVELGTYLLSLAIYDQQKLEVDGKTYHLLLRFKRTYQPYTIHLDRFDHKVFVGTDIPRDFRSHIRLTDPRHGIKDRPVQIFMNSPMRHEGETFFQASFIPGDSGTVLQVVRNPGWLLPYISCIVVALGLMFHFGLHLFQFLEKRVAL